VFAQNTADGTEDVQLKTGVADRLSGSFPPYHQDMVEITPGFA
jgi:hypothetical protein